MNLILAGILVGSHSNNWKFSHYCAILNCKKPVNRFRNGFCDRYSKVVVLGDPKSNLNYAIQNSKRNEGPYHFYEGGFGLLSVKTEDNHQPDSCNPILNSTHPNEGLF